MAGKCLPKHSAPFFIKITLKCEDFPVSPLLQSFPNLNQVSTRRSLVVRLRADVLPFACENFRQLCLRGVDAGGYLGSEIHDITPGIEFCGGLDGSGRSASAFAGGRPFDDLSEEELDHGAYAIGMCSGEQHQNGQFGSQFYICGSSVEDGSVQAALLDDDEGHLPVNILQNTTEYIQIERHSSARILILLLSALRFFLDRVIGEVVDGWLVLEMLESLASSKKWLSAQMKNKRGKVTATTQASAPGGRPACPVLIHEAKEIDGVWTAGQSGSGRRSGSGRKGSSFRGSFKQKAVHLESMFAEDKGDGLNGGAKN